MTQKESSHLSGDLVGPTRRHTLTTNLTNVRISNFTGTINDVNPGDNSCLSVPCWYIVVNATKTEALIFDLIQGYGEWPWKTLDSILWELRGIEVISSRTSQNCPVAVES